MATICFYQDSRHHEPLIWIRKILGIGYLSHRNDGMSELRINGFKQIKEILESLIPYIRFKQHQALALYEAVCMLSGKSMNNLNSDEIEKVIKCITAIQSFNYATKHKKSELELKLMLGLTP